MLQHNRITFNLFCEWKHIPPVYRLYFNDELMVERTYIWDNEIQLLQENMPVWTDSPGPHTITIEQVGLHTGEFKVDTIGNDELDLNFKII